MRVGLHRDEGVLHQRNFRLLWAGNFVSVTGDFLLFLALPVWVFQLTGSAAALGGSMAVQLLPGLLSPVAGMVADRVDRRYLMLASDLLRALLLLNLLWVRSGSQVWAIYLTSFLISLVSLFFRPARGALLPTLVHDAELTRANSLMGASTSAAQLLGTGVGPLLLAAFGPQGLVKMDAVSFLISALLVSRLRLPVPPQAAAAMGYGWRALTEGFQAIRRSLVLRWVVILGSLEMVAARPVMVLSLIFIMRALHLPASYLGYLLMCQGVGDIAGAAAAGAMASRLGPTRFVILGLAVLTVGSAGFAFSRAASAAFLAYFLIGFGIGVKSTGDETLLQSMAPRGVTGGVYAATSAVYMLISAGVAPLAGALADWLPLGYLLNGSWILFSLATGLAAWGLRSAADAVAGNTDVGG